MPCFIVYFQNLNYSGYVNDRVFLNEEEAQDYVKEKQNETTNKLWNYEPSLLR